MLVLVEAHPYTNEGLHDEYFDDPGFAIAGPEAMEPLSTFREGKLIDIPVWEGMTIGSFRDEISKKVLLQKWDNVPSIVHFFFVVGNERMSIDNSEASFDIILKKYLVNQRENTVHILFLISNIAGCILEKDKWRFVMNSKEKARHKLPHVHVEDTSHHFNASIDIIHDKVLAGNISGKNLKRVVEIIEENREYFLRSWNTLTDGLSVDINHGLRLPPG